MAVDKDVGQFCQRCGHPRAVYGCTARWRGLFYYFECHATPDRPEKKAPLRRRVTAEKS